MRSVMVRLLAPLAARLGSRTILTVGGTLFLINMLVPDPIPLLDEILLLVGTIMLSRMARSNEPGATRGPAGVTVEPKPVGRGSTQRKDRVG